MSGLCKGLSERVEEGEEGRLHRFETSVNFKRRNFVSPASQSLSRFRLEHESYDVERGSDV